MAYSAGPRSRPPPQRGYGDLPANSYAPQEHEYGPSHKAYGNGKARGGKQRGPQPDPGYGAQEQYDGYNINPWSHEPNGHENQYGNYDDSYSNWNQDGRHPQAQPGQSRGQEATGNYDYRGQGQPNRPPLRDQFSQESVPSLYDNDGGYGNLNSQSYGAHGGTNHNQRSENGNSAHHTNPMPFRDRPQPRSAARSNEEDQLPRYMNGHAHRFSNESSRVNGQSRPPLGGPHYQGNVSSRGEVAWDNSYPDSQNRPYRNPNGASANSRPFPNRSSPEHEYNHFASEVARPQTAEGFRRNGPPANIGGPSNGYAPDNHGGNYDYAPEPASSLSTHSRDDTKSGNSTPFGNERSQTMTSNAHNPTTESGLIPVESSGFQEPGAVSGYYGSSGQKQEVARSGGLARAQTEDPYWKNGNVAQPVQTYASGAPHLPIESRAEIFDASHEEQRTLYGHFNEKRSPPADDEMPNFDASPRVAGRGQGMTVDDHLQPQQGISRGQPQLYQNEYNDLPPPSPFRPDEIPRSRSQPDFSGPPPFSGPQGGEHGMTVPRPAPYDRPATSASFRDRGPQQHRNPQAHPPRSVGPGGSSSRGGYGPRDPYVRPARHDDQAQLGRDQHRGPSPRLQSGPGQHRTPPPGSRIPPTERRGAPDPRMQKPDRIRSPASRGGRPTMDLNPTPLGQRRSPLTEGHPTQKPTGRHPSLDKPLPNPDALPSHPVPVRPGLSNAQQSAPNSRPPPVRQYNAPSSDPHQHQVVHNGPLERRVTPQELEHLRQKTLKIPNDSATQFLLAQKLAEAADVLVDERTDPASKKRTRDRYQADAIKIIKNLSALSYADADFFYADCYSRGALGLQPDIKEAFLLYQKAAKANHAQAAYRVAVCCELGQEDGGGTKRDAVKAMQWYKRAATLGDAAAKYKMGVILLKGLLGQPRNPPEGLNWLKKASEVADKENPHSLHELVSTTSSSPCGRD